MSHSSTVPALTLPEFLQLTLPKRTAYLSKLENMGANGHRRHLVEAQSHWTVEQLETHLLQALHHTTTSSPSVTNTDLYHMLAHMEL